jgi:DNA-binding SARP family transcriptional activator/TolB-like protein
MIDSKQVGLRLHLIGRMAARTRSGDSVLPTGRKTRALLAIVALSVSRSVSRDRLAELLWSDRSQRQSRASLRQEVLRLREALAAAANEVLITSPDHLAIRPGAVWVDVAEVMSATPDNPASLSLLDGSLLEDLNHINASVDRWLVVERDRLRDHARSVAEAVLRAQVEPAKIITASTQLLAIDRADEFAWRALMRAHADLGDRANAIRIYDRCRTTLIQLFDVAPSTETQKLLVEIRGPSGSRSPARPPAATHATVPAWLPGAPPTPPAVTAEPLMPDLPVEPGAFCAYVRIGVMPLRLMGTVDDDAPLAARLAEEISDALSLFRWMCVTSFSSIARLAQSGHDEIAIRRQFGVDFLLDGTIQRAGECLRITLRLLDLRAGNTVVWARRFERQSDNILSLQDEISAEVAAQIDPLILRLEAERAASLPVADAGAHDLVLRALPLSQRMDRGSFTQAGGYLARAVRLEPESAGALAWYAYWHAFVVGQGWADDIIDVTRNADKLAERAIQLDPRNARALTIAGHIRAFLHGEPQQAAALHDRALLTNPHFAMSWALSAITYAYIGKTAEAENRFNRYKRLSPLDPFAFFFDGFVTLIHLQKHDHEAAVASGRAIIQQAPLLSAALKPYLSALGHLGCASEAEIIRHRLMSVEPGFSVERFLLNSPFERESDKQHFAEGLRLAGVAETVTKAVRPD